MTFIYLEIFIIIGADFEFEEEPMQSNTSLNNSLVNFTSRYNNESDDETLLNDYSDDF